MDGDLWVFGYGSLMWNPGFVHSEAVHARLVGYHRAFCIYSMHYRGTARQPGLILGLDRGGVCEGVAFRVPPRDADAVRRYLRSRELITGVYREALLPVTLARPHGASTDPEVRAMTFIAERAHPAFAGDLPLARQARLVRKAKGLTGLNLDYVLNTASHLAALGIRERRIERLVVVIGALPGRAGSDTDRGQRTQALAAGAAVGGRLRPAAGRLRPGERKRFLYRRALAQVAAPDR
jgi:cation transport protein ChaC